MTTRFPCLFRDNIIIIRKYALKDFDLKLFSSEILIHFQIQVSKILFVKQEAKYSFAKEADFIFF